MTEYAKNARADVNGDGFVNAGDLLEVRSPANWNKPVRPEDGSSPRTRIDYAGTDPAGCALDVRASNLRIEHADMTSTAHGVVSSAFWKTAGLILRDCTIRTVGYGVYSECDGLTILATQIVAQRRDPLRIAGGRGILIEDVSIDPVLDAVAVRVHESASQLVFRRCIFHNANPWCVDIGEQYRGAGGCVTDAIFEDCEFHAAPQTVMAVRVRGQRVVLRRCRGIGFAAARPEAVLVNVEKHSCAPIGCRLENCTIDGSRKLLGARWPDTVVV